MEGVPRARGFAFLVLSVVFLSLGLFLSLAFQWSKKAPSAWQATVDLAANIAVVSFAVGLILCLGLGLFILALGQTKRWLHTSAFMSTAGGLGLWGFTSAANALLIEQSSVVFWLLLLAWFVVSQLVIWASFRLISPRNSVPAARAA